MSAADPADVARALAAMAGKRALVVGDLMLDCYVYGETERVSREAPVLIVRKEREEYRLGAAANTAANLAALGLQVRLAGVGGDDDAARTLERMLGEAGCRTDTLHRCALATPVKTRILAGAFGTSRQQVLRLDAYVERTLQPEWLEAVANTVRRLAREVDVVVVSDYGHGVVTGQVIAALQEVARAGSLVCVDSRHNLRAFAGMAALTPNVPEAEALVGRSLHAPADVAAAGDQILRELRCKACLITLGQRGMTLFRPKAPACHVDVVGQTEVTDVTGAGDSVIATLAAALAAGLGVKNGMLLANCAAGVVVSRMGTASASPQDVAQAAKAAALRLEAWA